MRHMRTDGLRRVFLLVFCLALLCVTARLWGQSGAQSGKNGEWPTYGADLASTRYRPFDQIDASNECFSTTSR